MIRRIKAKLSKHPKRKKFVRIFTITFLGILFLEFLVYFGSNFFLVNWTRSKINESTGGVYEVDFNRLNFSLLRRGVFLNGIVMRPIAGHRVSNDQVVFDFTLDEIAVLDIWYDWSDKIFRVGKIELDNPDLGLILPKQEKAQSDSSSGFDKRSPVKELEEEIQKSIQRIPFGGLVIEAIEIKHADLFFLNFLSQKSLKAQNSKVIIENVDWTTGTNWDTPFNAEGFEFDLEQVEFPLSDEVHVILADKVQVSSLENLIDIQGFRLSPNRDMPSRSYYDLKLEELRVNNFDLNQAFMTSEVQIEEIVLNDPEFQMTNFPRELMEEEVKGEGDLNSLIDGILKSFSIREFSVNNGRFSSLDPEDSLRNRIEITDVDFKMAEFYLGWDASKRKNQFFYGKDAAMELEDFTLNLADGVHVIHGDKVSVSSFLDQIEVEGFQISPILDEGDSSVRQVISLSLPTLQLDEANLKKLYNEAILDVDLLEMNQPKVEFIDRVAQKDSTRRFSAQKLLQGYLEEVNIGLLSINEGTMQFQNETGARSDNVNFEQFSLQLEDVFLRPESSASMRDLLLAEELVLSLDQYQLKLRDNLHLFTADQILIDSKQNLVEVKNFELKPENPDQIQQLLTTYGKSATIDLTVPVFKLQGIDIRAALLDKELLIDYILVSQPHLIYDQLRKRNQENNREFSASSQEIQDLLADYFKVVSIDSIGFFQGKMDFTDITGRQEVSFSEEDLSLLVRDFYYDPAEELDLDRSFFSEEIILNLAGYSFSLAKGDYDVSTGNVQYNTKTQAITIDSLVLNPGPQLDSKLALSLVLPKLTLEGLDLEDFLYENRLDLSKLTVDGSQINLDIEPDFVRKEEKRNRRSGAFSRTIDFLRIQEILANESDLRLTFQIADKEVESIQARFDVSVSDFFLDEETENELVLAELFDEISLAVNDFSFALPDSLHKIRFSEVLINNKADETVFLGLEIEPVDLENSKGMVLSGRIDELGIRNNTLAEIQRTGKVNLENIRLSKPDIQVFLDTLSPPNSSTKTDPKPKNEEAFVHSLLLQNLLISDGKIKFNQKGKGAIPRLDFQGIDLEINDLDIDLLDFSAGTQANFFLDEDLRLSIRDYELISKDGMEVFHADKISFAKRNVLFEGLQYKPTMGTYEYLRKKGYQTDAISLDLATVSVEAIDLDKMMSGEGMEAKRIIASGMNLDVLRDKRIAPKEGQVKPMPQEIIQNLPVNLRVDSVFLQDGFVRYQEFVTNSMLPGKVEFEELEAVMTPLAISESDRSHPIKESYVLATAKLMGTGDLGLQVQMSYDDPYPMELTAQIDTFNLQQINNILSRGAFLRINSGEVKKGDWSFRLDKQEAFGRMDFRYEGLNVTFLDSVSLTKGKGKLGMMTFLANTLIKNNNPRKFLGNVVRSDIYLKRDQSKFIFNAWWKATLTGLKGSVGLGQPQLPVRRKEEEE